MFRENRFNSNAGNALAAFGAPELLQIEEEKERRWLEVEGDKGLRLLPINRYVKPENNLPTKPVFILRSRPYRMPFTRYQLMKREANRKWLR